MDDKENLKTSPSRRPLPTPGTTQARAQPSIAADESSSTSAAPQPTQAHQAAITTSSSTEMESASSDTSITEPPAPSERTDSTVIPASSFYASKTGSTVSSSRPQNLGSNRTVVYERPSSAASTTAHWGGAESSWTSGASWADPLPSYGASVSKVSRPASHMDLDDDIPPLVPVEDTMHTDYNENVAFDASAWSTGPSWSAADYTSLVPIDGREMSEEDDWWDTKRKIEGRPGPGILPPVLADSLHNPDHTLWSVSHTEPALAPAAGATSNAPTFDEVRASKPHPDALYCPKDHGWVIIQWGESDTLPRLAPSFEASKHHPLPRRPSQRSPDNCVDPSAANVTHHIHRYEKAVDARLLNVPYHPDRWAATTFGDDAMDVDDDEGSLFDLYVCCQCTFYLVRSPVIPAVIPRSLFDKFVDEKVANPPPGRSSERATAMGMETLLMAIENNLWKGEMRMLRVEREGFRKKMGWSPIIKQVFELLGFRTDSVDGELCLQPPITNPDTPQGKHNRARFLRAWTEIAAWTADYERIHPALYQHEHKGYRLWVSLKHERENYQKATGSHPDQIPRNDYSSEIRSELEKKFQDWRVLGLTPITFSDELLTFAYLAQCRCDPRNTIQYYTKLRSIAMTLAAVVPDVPLVTQLLHNESERGRFTYEDIQAAAQILGFGAEGSLRVEYETDVPDEFVENAWKECIKRSWRDSADGTVLQSEATKALKILAQSRASHTLMRVWEQGKNGVMSPEKAYLTIEVPETTDDDMLITIYNMRIEDAPLQMDKMREALTVIAEVRDSERLRKLLNTGTDPGFIAPQTRPDLPRGLNQLGNTCYLNSLLQYFYTIKDLRNAVALMKESGVKAAEEDKLTDDDLKRHRVGGRLVTRREIVRSKKFISLLASLFFDLEYAEHPAVTPALELAKLALVTSKDEEEDEDKGGTDSSNDTDATLVEDGPARATNPDSMDVDPPRTTSPVQGEAGSSKKPPPLPPRKPTESSSTMMFGKQHDVAECMDNCMFQIETALLRFDGMQDDKTSVVKRLFYGKIRQRIYSEAARSSVHEKEDLFSHLPVNVNDEGVDIYDGLSTYFDDVVEFEGNKARMEVTLVETPPLLQIQLQRVQFNRETLQPFKSQAYVKFGETIYMDRFLDSADPQKKSRGKAIQAELNKSRERVRELQTSKNKHTFSSKLDKATRYLALVQSVTSLEQDVLESMKQDQARIGEEIEEERARARQLKEELEALWQDSTDAPYELTSVFIHRGSSPSFGHYFFYSRHLPEAPDAWFKYNDSDVSDVAKSEVLADTTGSTANPYLLVFARKGSEIVDTVNRVEVVADL